MKNYGVWFIHVEVDNSAQLIHDKFMTLLIKRITLTFTYRHPAMKQMFICEVLCIYRTKYECYRHKFTILQQK